MCLPKEYVQANGSCEVIEEQAENVLLSQLKEPAQASDYYNAPSAGDDGYFCGAVEHTHSALCYSFDGSLRCTLPEHTHALACKSDSKAEIENSEKWETAFNNLVLTGNWSSDILDIAKAQLDYTESTRNYEAPESGETVNNDTGYGDQGAEFCSFCIDYAGVEDYPLETDCTKWIKALSLDENEPDKPVYYHEAGTYEPKPGDLVFFDLDMQDSTVTESRDSEHVGFVEEVTEATEEAEGTPAQLITIESNSADKVQNVTYDFDDERILGYGEIPENENYKIEIPGSELFYTKIKSEPAEDGAIAVISGALPDNAEATIEAVTLSEEELVAYFGKNKASAMTSLVAYDIKILAAGEEWQPDDTVSVVICNPDIAVTKSDSFAVAHVDGKTETVSDVTADVTDAGNVTFEAEGFSTYIIYTVEFWYGEYMYSINGNSELLLSELFTALGIKADVSEAVSVEFSNPSLITVEQTETDWKLITEVPFLTEECLTVVLSDGTVLSIRVTDEYAPVEGGGELIYGTAADSWYVSDKLRMVEMTSGRNPSPISEDAYFYHTEIKASANYRENGSNVRYKFANGVNDDATHTFDTIEFRNAYCYPNNEDPENYYNICLKVHLNSTTSRTLRWTSSSANKTYLSSSGGTPYLSVSVFTADTGQGALPTYFDIDWEMWLEKPDTHEKVTFIPLMGGSCYIGDEYVTVYSTDDKIYTNFPTTESFNYVSETNHHGWYHAPNDYDDPNFYALGVVGAEDVVKGRYITLWDANDFACELTANLYELPVMVSKSVSGENSGITADTAYRFRAGFNDPFNNNTLTYLGGHDYTIRNADQTTASSGTLPASGEFSLKAGQNITIEGLQAINVPVQIEEFTASGTHTYDYYEYMEGTTAVADSTNLDIFKDLNSGTQYIRYNLSEATNIAFTNVLKEEHPTAPLTVTKSVTGSISGSSEKFPVRIKVTNEDNTAANLNQDAVEASSVTDIVFSESVAGSGKYDIVEFKIISGGRFSIPVDIGAKVEITETSHNGFSPYITVTGGAGDDALNDTANADSYTLASMPEYAVTAAIINKISNPLPLTGGRVVYPLYLVGILLIAGSVLFACKQTRKQKKA